jgi:5-methylcytosine-specific restriction endonuclease McrA
MPKRINYRKLAFEHYPPICAHCGFGVPEVLEVAHLDGRRSNNKLANLVILCPNCHKMYDLDLIAARTIIEMRDREKKVDWSKRMKDAGQKAAATRKKRAAALRRRRRAAGRKAAETRRHNRGT